MAKLHKKGELIAKLQNTGIADQKSLHLLGSIIRKEFDATECEERAFELLQLAYKYQVPQLDEMLNDYSLTDFKWL
jgi:hypothetical protein